LPSSWKSALKRRRAGWATFFNQGAEVAEFSAADVAFTGFRIVWARPWAVAIWAGLQILVNVALKLFIAASAGAAMVQIAQIGVPPPGADPGPMLALIRQVAPTYVVLMIVGLVVSAVFYAAMNRAVMRPRESRFGYLRLAGDELRQLGLFALLLLVFFALYMMIGISAVVLLTLLGMALGNPALATALLLVIVLPATIGVFIYVGVRFSLASPLTFAGGRIDLAGSWRLTRGRFWPLLGAYCIAMALNLVVLALIFVIAVLAVGILGGGFAGLQAFMQSDPTSVAAVLTPAQLIYLAILSIGAALSAPITTCPPAAIYLALTGGQGALGKVFD
jgi:hypothetical protein